MVNIYKIQLDLKTYHEVFEPFLQKNFLKMPISVKDDLVEVTIRRTCVLEYLQRKLVNEIDNYEIIQAALMKKSMIN